MGHQVRNHPAFAFDQGQALGGLLDAFGFGRDVRGVNPGRGAGWIGIEDPNVNAFVEQLVHLIADPEAFGNVTFDMPMGPSLTIRDQGTRAYR